MCDEKMLFKKNFLRIFDQQKMMMLGNTSKIDTRRASTKIFFVLK